MRLLFIALILLAQPLAAEGLRIPLAIGCEDFTWYLSAQVEGGVADVAAYRNDGGTLAIRYRAECQVVKRGKLIVIDAHGAKVEGPQAGGWMPDSFVIDAIEGRVTRWDAYGNYHLDDVPYFKYITEAQPVYDALRHGTPLPPTQQSPGTNADLLGPDDF